MSWRRFPCFDVRRECSQCGAHQADGGREDGQHPDHLPLHHSARSLGRLSGRCLHSECALAALVCVEAHPRIAQYGFADDMPYLLLNEDSTNRVKAFVEDVLTFIILYNNLIPIRCVRYASPA